MKNTYGNSKKFYFITNPDKHTIKADVVVYDEINNDYLVFNPMAHNPFEFVSHYNVKETNTRISPKFLSEYGEPANPDKIPFETLAMVFDIHQFYHNNWLQLDLDFDKEIKQVEEKAIENMLLTPYLNGHGSKKLEFTLNKSVKPAFENFLNDSKIVNFEIQIPNIKITEEEMKKDKCRASVRPDYKHAILLMHVKELFSLPVNIMPGTELYCENTNELTYEGTCVIKDYIEKKAQDCNFNNLKYLDFVGVDTNIRRKPTGVDEKFKNFQKVDIDYTITLNLNLISNFNDDKIPEIIADVFGLLKCLN